MRRVSRKRTTYIRTYTYTLTHFFPRPSTRPTLSQHLGFKICRSAFLKYIQFADLLMLMLSNCGRAGRVVYMPRSCFNELMAWLAYSPAIPFHSDGLSVFPRPSTSHATQRGKILLQEYVLKPFWLQQTKPKENGTMSLATEP